MKKKKLWILAVASILIAGFSFHQKTLAIDTGVPCSVEFVHAGDEDIKNSSLQIDLYKVGSIVPDPNYDTYSFSINEEFSLLASEFENLQTLDETKYTRIASDALDLILEQSIQPITQTRLNEKETIESGLYLAVPRGSDLETYSKNNMRGETITISQSGKYEYLYTPILFSLPTKEKVDDVISTANPTDWKYDTTITLKVEQELRNGSLRIHKILERHDGNGPATFVYKIDAYTDETKSELVYSNVETIVMNASGNDTIEILDRIPVGSYVEVTEIYSGASYIPTDGTIKDGTIAEIGDEISAVSFKNDSNNTDHHGSSIKNQYTNNGNDLEQDRGGQ